MFKIEILIWLANSRLKMYEFVKENVIAWLEYDPCWNSKVADYLKSYASLKITEFQFW